MTSPATATASPKDAAAHVSPWRTAATVWLGGWPAVVHLVCDLLLSPVYLTVLTLTFTAAVLLPVMGIGIPMLIAMLRVGLALGALERVRVYVATGRLVPSASGPDAARPWWHRLLLDRRGWRAQGHLALVGLWGIGAGAVVTVLSGLALALALIPFYGALLPRDRIEPPLLPEVSVNGGIWLVGVGLLALVPLLARVLVQVDVALAVRLLGPGGSTAVQALTRRVRTLTETRAGAVESGEAERRRIERDLHDGPQQHLVAIAMDLGMARAKLAAAECDCADCAAAQELVVRAHATSKDAIAELRRVVRGLHPPVLSDRGLDAALSALAARSPVPVRVETHLARRPDAAVEAIAYFCVSEALTNVAKHSGATGATVTVAGPGPGSGPGPGPSAGRGDWLRIEVSDDGRGGADPARGSGLTGLRQRLAAVDGDLRIVSPPGAGTTLTMDIPLGGALPNDAAVDGWESR